MTALLMKDARPMIDSGLLSGALLTLQHVLLYGKEGEHKLTRLQAYIAGVGTLGVAFTTWGLRTRDYRAIAAFWTILSFGSSPVLVGYWIRNYLADRDARMRTAGRLEQQAEAMRHGRTNEGDNSTYRGR